MPEERVLPLDASASRIADAIDAVQMNCRVRTVAEPVKLAGQVVAQVRRLQKMADSIKEPVSAFRATASFYDGRYFAETTTVVDIKAGKLFVSRRNPGVSARSGSLTVHLDKPRSE